MRVAKTVVVVAGGDPVPAGQIAQLANCVPDDAPVVAADSGVDVALTLGLRVHVAVGDFDSVSPEGLAAVEAGGARVVRHPVAKDATDLELAVGEAVALGATDVLVLGGAGGRLDHLLAGVLALAAPAWRSLRIQARLGDATLHVLHGPTELQLRGRAGQLLTLLPVGGPARGVRTGGLRYPLRGEELGAGTTRGVSNVLDDDEATVALDDGTLLVVLPGDEPSS